MRSDHRARRGGAGPQRIALAVALVVAWPLAARLHAQTEPQPSPPPSAPVQGEDLSQPSEAPTPIAPPPPVAAPTPTPGPTLEQQAEEKYAAGDLEGAAAIYRELAVATSAPPERLRLL